MPRLDGWEARLAALLEDARAKPYVIGEHDCFRLACRVVEALTGRDLWPAYGGYTTPGEALRAIARLGSSFEACFDRVFGVTAEASRYAQLGDICAIQTDDGQKHLGVCVGATTWLLAKDGLVDVPTLTCLCCWRVG